MKFVLTVVFVFIFSGCVAASPQVSLKQIQLKSKNQIITQALNNASIQYYPGFCITEAYTLNSQDIFLENIHLDQSYKWNGFSRGYFQNLFEEKLNLASMKIVFQQEIENYELITYKINDKYYLDLIYQYGAFKDVFILDFKGELFYSLLKSLEPSYTTKPRIPRFKTKYDESLVRYNFFNNYFGKDSSEVLIK